MKNKLKLAVFALLALASFQANAATVIQNINLVKTGATPSGPAPWATLTFTDVSENLVQLSVQSNVSVTEFISEVNLTVNSSVNLDRITCNYNGGSGDFTTPTFVLDRGKINGGGDKYDVGLNFATTNNGRFDGSETATFLFIGGSEAITANDFGDSVAHIQGIPSESGTVSSWSVNSVPEPTSAVLLGAAGIVALLRRRR